MAQGTILQKRNKIVRVSKEETLMILRTYQIHPSSWIDIIDDMKENKDQLPQQAKQLYTVGTNKQLRERMSTKLSKLLAAPIGNIKDRDISEEIRKIKALETRHTEHSNIPRSGTSSQSNDDRDAVAMALSSSEEDGHIVQVEPSSAATDTGKSATQRRNKNGATDKPKKRPLTEIIRKNKEEYHKFITKKVPKLLRQLGVSSDSDSD